jgi:hypothetical protein
MGAAPGEPLPADLISPLSSCVNDFKANTLDSPRRTQPTAQLAEVAPPASPQESASSETTAQPFTGAELEGLVPNPLPIPAAAAIQPNGRPVRSGRSFRVLKAGLHALAPPPPPPPRGRRHGFRGGHVASRLPSTIRGRKAYRAGAGGRGRGGRAGAGRGGAVSNVPNVPMSQGPMSFEGAGFESRRAPAVA